MNRDRFYEFLSREEIEDIFDRIEEVRVGVVGDFCLDIYLTIDPSRSEISVETGLPTLPVREEHHYLGGAGNVVSNLVSLGVKQIEAFGVVGRDVHGEEIKFRLESSGVDASGIIFQDDNWDTCAYTKLYEGESEDKRIDYGRFNQLSNDTADRLLGKITDSLMGLKVVIINQQLVNGIHIPYFRGGLKKLIREHPEVIFIVDSRDYSDEFDGAYRKINVYEGEKILRENHAREGSTGRNYISEEKLSLRLSKEIGARLYERWKRPLFLTRAEYGLLVYCNGSVAGDSITKTPYEIPGMIFFSRIDPVGAGDSLLAGLSVGLALGYSPVKAGFLGNLVAGVTVQKLFRTGTATREEIIELYDNAMYRLRPELAASIRGARYLKNSEIEIITNIPPKSFKITHAIFDHDGTISTLRQGWESVMEQVMLKSILGDRYNTVDESEFERVRERVLEYIDKTTGVQTLVQMEGLVELVREFGYVDEAKIPDSYGYKIVYLKALGEYIRGRIEKFRRGELSIEDLTLKGVVSFLSFLRDRGVRLYLASGTDREDVKREAELLGYGELFEGRIYGATGSILHEPKRMVMKEILRGEILSGSKGRGKRGVFSGSDSGLNNIVVFGDGPVEIREGWRMGCYTVGVASDEIRRYGLNLSKRRRVIEAGADLVIPDFSQKDVLEGLLF